MISVKISTNHESFTGFGRDHRIHWRLPMYRNIFLCIALSYIDSQAIIQVDDCNTNSVYVDLDVDSKYVISFESKICIDYVKDELFAYLSIFVTLFYHVVKIFATKVTAPTKPNTDSNSRNDALQSVLHGFSFYFWQIFFDGLQSF